MVIKLNDKQVMVYLDKMQDLRAQMERGCLKLQDLVACLPGQALDHQTRIIVGILAGMRMYLIKNEGKIVKHLTERTDEHGKAKSDEEDTG